MKKSTRIFSLLLVLLMAVCLTAPALAALNKKTIEVYTGVDIYIDDVKLNPTDVNGNPVEAFVYNGTTYLPVRAVGEAVGKVVQWEGKTNSVYLGKHTGERPAVWLEDMVYFTGRDNIDILKDPKNNLGDSYSHAVYLRYTQNVYLINGQYSAISGTLFQTFDKRSENETSYIEIYGDDELLYRAEVTAGQIPVDFYVDLTGVLKLEIRGNTYDSWSDTIYAGVADLGLWT